MSLLVNFYFVKTFSCYYSWKRSVIRWMKDLSDLWYPATDNDSVRSYYQSNFIKNDGRNKKYFVIEPSSFSTSFSLLQTSCLPSVQSYSAPCTICWPIFFSAIRHQCLVGRAFTLHAEIPSAGL